MQTQHNNPNWFIDQLALYQNANSSAEAVKQNFLIRVEEFETIINALKNKEQADPLQHELILGWRGSGKSTLLRRIQIEIDEDAHLQHYFIAINLAEEQNSVARLSDLWFEVLEELQQRQERTLSLERFDTFDDEESYARYLYGQISKLLADKGKRVVLLIDNIDRVFENLDDDGHLMREQLINYRNLQIIGASTRMSEHFWRYDKPFYDFFRVHKLKGLSFDEIHRLLNRWAESMQIPMLKDYAINHRGRVEAMRILTNGLPRAMQVFIQILLHDSTLFGFDYLRKTMDGATPIYQERLGHLTTQHRKIVQELAFLWEASPTKTLVEKCRMESKLISSLLKQLVENDIVEKVSTGKKNHLYRLNDRFFNMWLIVTQGNPEQKRKAKYLTIFLETFYEPEELKRRAKEHLQDLVENKFNYDKAMLLSKAFAQSRYVSVEERDKLIELTVALGDEKTAKMDMPQKFSEIFKQSKALYEAGKHQEALRVLETVENEADGILLSLKGLNKHALKLYSDAEMYYKLASQAGQAAATFLLGVLCHNQDRDSDAEKYFKLAIEAGDTNAIFYLGVLLNNQDKHADAEILYKLAAEAGNTSALNNLGLLYCNQEKYSDAEMVYKLAIEAGNTLALNNLSVLYKYQEKYTDAEKYFKLAVEAGDIKAITNLAMLYWTTNHSPKQALDLYQRAPFSEYYKENILIFEVWNNILGNLDQKIEHVVAESKDPEEFLKELLSLGQTHLVLKQFRSETFGKDLIERYQLLYYAAQIVSGQMEENLLLRIPPEVMPTVEALVAKIKEKQAFYAQPPRDSW